MAHNFSLIRWQRRDVSFSNFLQDYDRNIYDLEPEHQREVVHTPKWRANIITSFLTFNYIPPVTFFTKISRDGGLSYVSLDGKQRCTAIIQFMKDELSVNFSDTAWKDDYSESVTLSKLTSEHRRIMEHQLQLEIKISEREFNDEEISRFFQNAQQHQKTSLGEHLNSSTQSRIRSMLLSGRKCLHDVFGDGGENGDKNKRHQLLEMMARMGYVYWSHYREGIQKFDETPAVLKKWFAEPSTRLNEGFIETVRRTMPLLKQANIQNKKSKTTILPVYKWFLSKCSTEEGEFKDEEINRFERALASGQIVLDQVAGYHDASTTRYLQLCEFMNQFEIAE